MEKATIEYPDEVRLCLNVSPAQVAGEIRMAAAVELYELGRLSSGRAAELAGVSRVQFPHVLARYGVDAFTLSEEELAQDIENARPR